MATLMRLLVFLIIFLKFSKITSKSDTFIQPDILVSDFYVFLTF